ncbi:MAG: energy transducer TonB [Candidatus Omnitrophota bacterium]
MFTDPVFRIALTISLLAHLAVIAPWTLFPLQREALQEKDIELNYVVIENPSLAKEEEVYSTGVAREEQFLTDKTTESDTRHQTSDIRKELNNIAYLKYYNLIREKIRAEIHSLRKRSEEGTVKVMFTIAPDGSLQGIDSAGSGVSASLGRKVARGIKKAAPFPCFPAEMGTNPLKFSLTIRFLSDK